MIVPSLKGRRRLNTVFGLLSGEGQGRTYRYERKNDLQQALHLLFFRVFRYTPRICE